MPSPAIHYSVHGNSMKSTTSTLRKKADINIVSRFHARSVQRVPTDGANYYRCIISYRCIRSRLIFTCRTSWRRRRARKIGGQTLRFCVTEKLPWITLGMCAMCMCVFHMQRIDMKCLTSRSLLLLVQRIFCLLCVEGTVRGKNIIQL